MLRELRGTLDLLSLPDFTFPCRLHLCLPTYTFLLFSMARLNCLAPKVPCLSLPTSKLFSLWRRPYKTGHALNSGLATIFPWWGFEVLLFALT